MRSASQTRSAWTPRERAWCRRISATVGGSPGMVAAGGGCAEEALDCVEVGFARRCSRDRVDDRDFGGDFVGSQPRSQVLQQRVGIGGSGLAQFHNRDRRLAEAVV